MEKIFRTKCMVTTPFEYDTSLRGCTITIDGEKVTFSCNYNGGKRYSVPLEFVKNIVKDYFLNGSTTMHIDETDSVAIRYTKGGLSPNDNHVTMSVSDYPETFMISADCTKFDKWIRSQIRKEVKT